MPDLISWEKNTNFTDDSGRRYYPANFVKKTISGRLPLDFLIHFTVLPIETRFFEHILSWLSNIYIYIYTYIYIYM